MLLHIAGATGALLSYGTTQLLADRTMASAIGNASRRALAPGTAQWRKAGLSQVICLVAALPSDRFDLGCVAWA